MVNPLASIPSPHAGQMPADIERPVIFPDPARQVTPAQETLEARTAGNPGSQQQPSSDSGAQPLDKVLEDLNNSMRAWATGMRFDVDPEAQRIVVSIVDSTSGEVLRTVPSEAVIRIAKMIVQFQGNSISTKA